MISNGLWIVSEAVLEFGLESQSRIQRAAWL